MWIDSWTFDHLSITCVNTWRTLHCVVVKSEFPRRTTVTSVPTRRLGCLQQSLEKALHCRGSRSTSFRLEDKVRHRWSPVLGDTAQRQVHQIYKVSPTPLVSDRRTSSPVPGHRANRRHKLSSRYETRPVDSVVPKALPTRCRCYAALRRRYR